MNILFYSEHCNYCKKLIVLINKKKLIDKFKFICVDTNINLPTDIKKVPTMLVNDIDCVLEGKYAFEWVVNKDYFYLKTNNIMKNNKNKIPIIPDNAIKGNESLDSQFAFITNKTCKSKYQNE